MSYTIIHTRTETDHFPSEATEDTRDAVKVALRALGHDPDKVVRIVVHESRHTFGDES